MWPVLGIKMEACRQLIPISAPQCLDTSVLVPAVRHSCPATSPGDPPRPAGRSDPGFCEVTAFSLGPEVHKTLCVSSKSGVYGSSSPMEFLQSSPTGLQNQVLWGLLLLMPNPQTGQHEIGSELSLLWETLCDIIIFQFVCRPPGRYGT